MPVISKTHIYPYSVCVQWNENCWDDGGVILIFTVWFCPMCKILSLLIKASATRLSKHFMWVIRGSCLKQGWKDLMNHSANIIIPTGTFCSLFVYFSESHTFKADGSLVSVPFIATQISWEVVSSVVTSRWSDFYCRNTSRLQAQPPFRWAAAPNRSSSMLGFFLDFPWLLKPNQNHFRMILKRILSKFKAAHVAAFQKEALLSPVLINTFGSRHLTHLHTLQKSKENPLFICFH